MQPEVTATQKAFGVAAHFVRTARPRDARVVPPAAVPLATFHRGQDVDVVVVVAGAGVLLLLQLICYPSEIKTGAR